MGHMFMYTQDILQYSINDMYYVTQGLIQKGMLSLHVPKMYWQLVAYQNVTPGFLRGDNLLNRQKEVRLI